ncbi:caspase family protein [Nocardia sp. SSK8]|uniref:caspase family protein n=1 Tax=Nocardia sp. SSK8 TaxID=3120154 RepID=UPI00300BA855
MPQRNRSRQRRPPRALLIGVTDYTEGFDPLVGPKNDVAELGKLLDSTTGGIYEVTPVDNPTFEMGNTIGDFLKAATSKSDLLIYFSGHGAVDDRGRLHLTHAKSQPSLGASALKYDDLNEWVLDSPARSVLVVLDCCRAGKAGAKGSDTAAADVREALRKARTQTEKVRVVLAAVPAHLRAEDAERPGDMSPFTERFVAAIKTAYPHDDGIVDLTQCLTRLGEIYDEADLVRPTPAGSHRLDDIHLAHRPDFVVKLLEREGLTPNLPQRNGGATHRGVAIVVPTAAANSVFSGLEKNHPAAVLVGGKEGTGKTWLLCEVVERMRAAQWNVHGFRPSGNAPAQPTALVDAIGTYLEAHRSPDKTLVVVDGIEWSEQWRRVVEEISRIVYERDVSLLVAVEGLSTTEWKMPGATTVAAPGTMTAINEFLRDLLAGDYYPELAQLPIADRQGLAAELKRQATTDLWAAVHLAPLVTQPDGLRIAGERLWRDRVGNIDDPDLLLAMKVIAGLSSFGIWAPIEPWTEPGVAAAQRLGADISAAGIRINSLFVNRALLARIGGGGLHLDFNWHSATREASAFMREYITTSLKTPSRHKDATAALARLKLYNKGFDDYVTDLAEAPSFSWQTWETISVSAASVAATLLVIRSSLPPKTAIALGRRLAGRVEDGQLDHATLPVVLDCLQVLRLTPGMQNDADMSAAWQTLLTLVERQLTDQRYGAETRIRALKVIHRFGNADSIAALRRIGPPLIARHGEVGQEDLRVLIELNRLLERSGTADGRGLRDQLAAWPEAVDLVQEGTRSTASRSAGYLARWLVAARIIDRLPVDSPQQQRLLRVLRSAAVNELRPIVDFCHTHHPALAAKILDTLEQDQWLRRRLLDTSPTDLADWIQTFGRRSPRKAAMQLRSGPRTLDHALLNAQEKALRVSSDRVACSKLLTVTARIEDQAGLLETGFAAALAARLGTKFLADQLVAEHRPSVMAHLVAAFLGAGTALDDELVKVALEIVSEGVRSDRTGRSPRLALILAADSADGQQFLEQLRGFAPRSRDKPMSRDKMRVYMQTTRDPGALAAFHRLGVLLYPDLAADYLDWLDEGDLKNRTFLRDVKEGMEPLPALTAAAAIASTLRNAGDVEVGRHILGVLEQHSPQASWAREILQSELVDLPPSLSLLYKLSPEDAHALVAEPTNAKMLFRKLSSCAEIPSIFFAILHVAARANGAAVGELIDLLDAQGTFVLAVEHLGTEADLFTQIEILRQIIYTSDRAAKRMVPDVLLDELFTTARENLPVLTNPRAVARLLESLAAWRRPVADRAVTTLNTTGLRMRFGHRKQTESQDTVHLADVVFDLDPARARDLLDEETFAWLLAKTPVEYLGNLVEIGLRQFPGVDTVRIVGDRFADIGVRPFTHDMWEVCTALGDVAWAIQRFGLAPLEIPEPADIELITRLPADTVLHGLAWLAPSDWRDQALAGLPTSAASTPNDAATRLAAYLHLGLRDRWAAADAAESVWRPALAAAAPRLRPLLGALAGLPPADREVVRRHLDDLDAVRARLRSGAAAWRRHATESIVLLDTVLDPTWLGSPGPVTS